MAQGRKQILVGDDRFIYDTDHFFLASVTVPVAGQVLDATPARPCLSLAIALEPALISSVIAEAGLPQLRATPSQRALDSCRMTAPLASMPSCVWRANVPRATPILWRRSRTAKSSIVCCAGRKPNACTKSPRTAAKPNVWAKPWRGCAKTTPSRFRFPRWRVTAA